MDKIYIVKIERLVESFEHDKQEKYIYASSWNRTTNTIVFPTKKEAENYIAKLKKLYRAKGTVKSGHIHGKKTIFQNNEEQFRSWDVETSFSKEVEITGESDVGEYEGY